MHPVPLIVKAKELSQATKLLLLPHRSADGLRRASTQIQPTLAPGPDLWPQRPRHLESFRVRHAIASVWPIRTCCRDLGWWRKWPVGAVPR